MLLSIDYQSLCDFQGLPTVRETLAYRANGFIITNMPSVTAQPIGKLELGTAGGGLFKKDLVNAPSSLSTSFFPILDSLHKLSHEVFKNLSHALELPWERYLGEMHEFNASGQDELQIMKHNESIQNAWSTLTIVVDEMSPNKATVLYGSALSVFSEGQTVTVNHSTLDESLMLEGVSCASGARLIYHVRPNDDVFYTRTAGALMKPLSKEEYALRKRVREISLLAQ